MSWDVIIKQLIKEAREKKDKELEEQQPKNRRVFKVYSLGAQYGRVYFTQREAECMVKFLKGKTLSKVAEELQLSPRTIEFYLKNMKVKLGCRTKFELLEKVYKSDFIRNIDFD